MPIGMGDRIATPHWNVLVQLCEPTVGLAEHIRVGVSKLETVIHIQTKLSATGLQAGSRLVYAHIFLGRAGEKGTGGQGRGDTRKGQVASGRSHGQLLYRKGRNAETGGPMQWAEPAFPMRKTRLGMIGGRVRLIYQDSMLAVTQTS
jgi:hypothetical protein